MTWTEPITDRTAADITLRTAKAYFNVSDWTRIYNNSLAVKAQLQAELDTDTILYTLTPPTVTTIPTAAALHRLAYNLTVLRRAAALPAALGWPVFPYVFREGPSGATFDYKAVNAWERTLALLHDHIPHAGAYRARCGVPAAGQARVWQGRWRASRYGPNLVTNGDFADGTTGWTALLGATVDVIDGVLHLAGPSQARIRQIIDRPWSAGTLIAVGIDLGNGEASSQNVRVSASGDDGYGLGVTLTLPAHAPLQRYLLVRPAPSATAFIRVQVIVSSNPATDLQIDNVTLRLMALD